MNKSRRGSVLLVALWATATLATVQIAQATRLSLEFKRDARRREQIQAWYLAWTGVELALARLKRDDPAWDAPGEAWSQVPERPVSLEFGTFSHRIIDEQGKIPLNLAPESILTRLPGFNPEAARRLLERRNDPEGSKPVLHLGELPALGVDSQSLHELESIVTVHGSHAVNVNTASGRTLETLGLSATLANQIMQYRLGPDGEWRTRDDRVFADPQQIPLLLEEYLGTLPPEDQTALASLLGSQPALLGVTSSLFLVESEGRSARYGIRKRIAAVLDRGGAIHGWHEE